MALLAFRDEMRFLPGYFENVAPHVDGIIALDDGSTDGSAEFVASQPSVLELLRKPSAAPHIWNDSENHRLLVEAAWRYDPDWLIGVDADERLERDFRSRALREIKRAGREGYLAYSVVIREVWDRPDAYRVDGIWGRKRVARFFKARLDHEFDDRRLHCHWAPLNSRRNGAFPKADLLIYHLRMMHESDRRARQVRYERHDPDYRWQAIGYDYMTDESHLRLEGLPPGREYEPLVVPPAEGRESAREVLPEPEEPHKPIPKLACVVLSLRNEPGLVAAVQSLLAQNKPLEMVVVNSGGGDAAGTLREAGIDEVEVIDSQERLYPGAARNVGINATRAPYIAFLAADCVAEPGWAAGRLRRHRAGALAVASAVTNPHPHNYCALASYVLIWIRRSPSIPPSDAKLYGVSYARELFDQFGRFHEDLRTGEDTEFHGRFTDTVPIEWAPEVRTAHREPTSFRELIRDQYARGKRMARALEELTGRPYGRTVAKRGWRRIPDHMAWSWLASKSRDRQYLVRSWLLIPPASAAYSLGALLSFGLSRATDAKEHARGGAQEEPLRSGDEPTAATAQTNPQTTSKSPDRPQLRKRWAEELNSSLKEERRKVQRLERQLQARERRIKNLERQHKDLERQLHSIRSSKTWKLLRKLSYARGGLVPGWREEQGKTEEHS